MTSMPTKVTVVPSYRVRMAVGALRDAVDPATVLPAAAAAAQGLAAVEASDIEVVRGTPRLTVRFEAPDDAAAAAVRHAVVGRTDELVEVEASWVYRRYGARWYPLGQARGLS